MARAALVALLTATPALLAGGAEEAIEKARELDARALKLREAGRPAEALPLAREALALWEEGAGPEHPEIAKALGNLALVLCDLAQHEAARPLLERALAMREKIRGPDHPETAATLHDLALLLVAQARFDDARPLLDRALAIQEKVLGPDHLDAARTLNALGGILHRQGRYDAAQSALERALAIREKALGPDHADVARILNNLGGVQSSRGLYAAAQRLYERALAIREKALGSRHPEVGGSLTNVAFILRSLGRYEEAKPLYDRALAIFEESLGPDHPHVATVLNNEGDLLTALGLFEDARAFHERALALRERALGAGHLDVAISLDNLAVVLGSLGQHAAARPLHERALAIREKNLGPRHPGVATSVAGLAVLLHEQGRRAEARPLYERAIAILEDSGPDHPLAAILLNNLAALLYQDGECAAARPLTGRSLAIREKALGADHPDVGIALNTLALLLHAEKRHAEARSAWVRALGLFERAGRAEHPVVARILANLARVCHDEGDLDAARAFAWRALSVTEARLRRGFSGVAGAERLGLTRAASSYLGEWLALAPRVGLDGYAELLRFKGLIARAEAAERALVRSGDERARRLRLDLLALDRGLGGLARRFPRKEGEREAWRKAYAEALAKRDALLLELARVSAPFRTAQARSDLGLAAVQASLPDGSALLDILRSQGGYLAWVLRAEGTPVRIDLGAADAIDAAAETFAREAAGGGKWEASGERLERLILAPLRKHLPSQTKRLYVCADAALAAVPFAALPGTRPGAFLLDEVEVVHLEAAQDVVPAARAPGEGALVVAGVDYDSADEDPPSPAPPSLVAVDRGPRPDRPWVALPATEREARLLGKPATVLSGAGATEARFRALAQGKRFLHLATHGYVREDRLKGLIRREGEGLLGPMLERQVAAGHDPMLLSGLVLAGANREGASGDDGLLTAAEASWLDLEGCDLVVLSACDTGRGTAVSGEGTLGLVRGFRLAGAARVVASLWKVDDEATGALMEGFYEGVLERGLEPARALREAALALRDRRDGEGKRRFSEARYWAAFVAYGR